jgi:hypothetical protein
MLYDAFFVKTQWKTNHATTPDHKNYDPGAT